MPLTSTSVLPSLPQCASTERLALPAQQPCGAVQREPERAPRERQPGRAAKALAAAAREAQSAARPAHPLLRSAGRQPSGLLASLGALRAGCPSAGGTDYRSGTFTDQE